MKSQLYLWKNLRKKYIRDLTQIKELYFEKIQPIFADAEKEAIAYKEKLWEDFMSRTCYGEDDYIDPADFAEKIEEEGFEKYEILSLMHYRNISMWISCMCQVWEQQLFSFIYNEARAQGIKYKDSDLKRGFGFVKEVFEYHGKPFETLDCWTKIKELRALVNVIKHSEGRSEKELRKMRPDYFEHITDTGKYDLLSLYHSTLLEETLQIKDQDFIDYHSALVQFWNQLPERMYSKEDI